MSQYKVIVYMPIGKSLDMAKFCTQNAIDNSGLELGKDYNFLFITGGTSQEVLHWIKENNFLSYEAGWNRPDGFLKCLYRCWNAGYIEGFKLADKVVAIGSDHAFYKDWLKNIISWAEPNTLINCKLIESGANQSLHSCFNLGATRFGEFNHELFERVCRLFYKEQCLFDEHAYGHRFDASPFVMVKDVWERFGPWNDFIDSEGWTGDSAFFNKCRANGVRIGKALNAISFHYGAAETNEGNKEGRY